MYLLIDNYDSFTYNLVHYLGELGADVEVHRNDAIGISDILSRALAAQLDAIILSPGPKAPQEAGICPELVLTAAENNIPLLGVCLGHQCIGHSFGARIIRSPHPVHGKTSSVHHNKADIFANLPDPLKATRYHSLEVSREFFPECLEVTAEIHGGNIMGMKHRTKPLYGVQFHPESIASEHGHALLGKFMEIARKYKKTPS